MGPKAGVHVCIHGRARQHRGPCEAACHTAGFTFCSVGTCVPVMVGFFNCYLSVKPSLAVLSYLSLLVCKPWVPDSSSCFQGRSVDSEHTEGP